MNKNIEILIVDYPDSNYLLSEIWYDNALIAIINQEHGDLEIELYPLKKNSILSLKDFCEAIEKAKKHLVGLPDENK